MDRRLWWIAIGLLALVGLAAPLASAQQAQTVNVEISGVVLDVPDELPGIYEAGLEVTTQASGGHCACRQTTVDLQARDVPEAVDAVVFSPSAYAVDWTTEPWEDRHHRAVHVNIGVSEIPDDASMLAVTVGADADSSNQLVEDRVQPTQLALPLPGDGEAEQAQADNGSTEASDGDEQGLAVAGTQAADQVEDGDTGGLALGTGAATAGLALTGLAVRRAWS